ncbi:MAG TPA: pilus assembly protein TadG-related protein [Xanthobacteraceae bacterium]|nr:pilus assembly protein TadG-related protein [Xanthobacteraceae bacterium]
MKLAILRPARRLAGHCRAFGRSAEGNVAIIFALAILPVVGALGAGDYARGNRIKSELQNAVDAAVRAAAKQPAGQQVAAAGNAFTANFTDYSVATPSTTFVVNANGSVTGSAQATVPTSFAQILKVPSMQVSATATAAISTSFAAGSLTMTNSNIGTATQTAKLMN